MIITTIMQFVAGLVALVIGADYLVRGASRIAAALGISSLVIGLTVVAFGTSAPELAVLLDAAMNDQADIAIGNIVGSNIANVLLVLGLSAVVAPLLVSRQLVVRDVPVMIGASLIMWYFASDQHLSQWGGAVLFILFVAYTIYSLYTSESDPTTDMTDDHGNRLIALQRERQRLRQEMTEQTPKQQAAQKQTDADLTKRLTWEWVKNVAFFLAGLGGVVLGAQLLVDSAVYIAEDILHIPTLIVGLTVVAVGTSLPEIATSVIAAMKGERDIAVGNIVGSNISNILLVLSLACIVTPNGIPISDAALAFDIPVMTGVALICLPIFYTHHEIQRWEGALFLIGYGTYTAYLVLNGIQSPALAIVQRVMIILISVVVGVLLLHALYIFVSKRTRRTSVL